MNRFQLRHRSQRFLLLAIGLGLLAIGVLALHRQPGQLSDFAGGFVIGLAAVGVVAYFGTQRKKAFVRRLNASAERNNAESDALRQTGIRDVEK